MILLSVTMASLYAPSLILRDLMLMNKRSCFIACHSRGRIWTKVGRNGCYRTPDLYKQPRALRNDQHLLDSLSVGRLVGLSCIVFLRISYGSRPLNPAQGVVFRVESESAVRKCFKKSTRIEKSV